MGLIELGFHIARKLRSGRSGRPTARVPGSRSLDWLPPVLGPEDWSIGLLADRSAGWYFDRH